MVGARPEEGTVTDRELLVELLLKLDRVEDKLDFLLGDRLADHLWDGSRDGRARTCVTEMLGGGKCDLPRALHKASL